LSQFLFTCAACHSNFLELKVKGLDIYVPPLTGKPEQQRFTTRSGVLSSISSRHRSAVSGRPLPERTDFGPRSLQIDGPNLVLANRTMAFTVHPV